LLSRTVLPLLACNCEQGTLEALQPVKSSSESLSPTHQSPTQQAAAYAAAVPSLRAERPAAVLQGQPHIRATCSIGFALDEPGPADHGHKRRGPTALAASRQRSSAVCSELFNRVCDAAGAWHVVTAAVLFISETASWGAKMHPHSQCTTP
jgi:hypothetical protein